MGFVEILNTQFVVNIGHVLSCINFLYIFMWGFKKIPNYAATIFPFQVFDGGINM